MKIQKEYVYMVTALLLAVFVGVLILSNDIFNGQYSQARTTAQRRPKLQTEETPGTPTGSYWCKESYTVNGQPVYHISSTPCDSGGGQGGSSSGGYTGGEGWLCRTFGYLCPLGGSPKPKARTN